MESNHRIMPIEPVTPYGFPSLENAIHDALTSLIVALIVGSILLTIITIARNYSKKELWGHLLISSLINGLVITLALIVIFVSSVIMTSTSSGFMIIPVISFFLIPILISRKINKKLGYNYKSFNLATAYLGLTLFLYILTQTLFYFLMTNAI